MGVIVTIYILHFFTQLYDFKITSTSFQYNSKKHYLAFENLVRNMLGTKRVVNLKMSHLVKIQFYRLNKGFSACRKC